MSKRLWLLQSEALCQAAKRRTGLVDFGEPPVEPGLSVLLRSLELQADLHPLGRYLMWEHLRRLLETRLRLVHTWNSHSRALAASRIERPVFITGMLRSGSTFLHELLAENPENRTPLVWEVMYPVPVGNRGRNHSDPRIRKAEADLWWFRRLAPGADLVYPMRARTPHECVAIHSYTMTSHEFVSLGYLPSYRAFLKTADLRLVYSWEKRFLQHLQLDGPARRWILKSPDHVYALEELFAVFPDAVIIQTHRHPIESLRSSVRLTRVLNGLFCRVADHDQIVKYDAELLVDGVRRGMRFRDLHPELASRFIDVNYRELVRDPLSVVRRICEQIGMRLNDGTAERIERVASRRSRYPQRDKDPSLPDLQLNEANVERCFEDYCLRFGIQG